ncbi:MAG: DUF4350 domain-containing protein [Deltaproteobacteria bacterium]
MRHALGADDKSLLIVSAVLLVGISLAGVLLAPEQGSTLGRGPSTYSTSSDGAKAAYLLLKELGYTEDRWAAPPTELPEDASNVVLILADPSAIPSSDETTALQWFVRRGGRVVSTGAPVLALLRIPGVVPSQKDDNDWKEFPARLPGPISRLAPSISMPASHRWKRTQPEGLEYYGDEEGATVARFSVGNGTIVWWADSSPLTNYGLKQSSNMNLLLNSVGPAPGTIVLWDEYYHGERRSLWSFLERTPLHWALIQALLLILAVILTFSRRTGPVAARVEVSRLSPLEFVETVGDLYGRKHAAQGVLEIAFHRVRSMVARRLGVAPETVPTKTGRAIQENFAEPGLATALMRCELAIKSGSADEAQALKLVQELHDYTRRLRLAGQGE